MLSAGAQGSLLQEYCGLQTWTTHALLGYLTRGMQRLHTTVG